MATITATPATNNAASVIGTFFNEKDNAQPKSDLSAKEAEATGTVTEKTVKEEPKTEVTPTKKETKPKKQPTKAKKVNVPKEKEATKKEKPVKPAKQKAVKVLAKDKNVNDYTLADARTRLRDANKESKSLSGTLKIILSFWNEGYKDAFAAIGLAHKDITVPNIQKLWHNDLKESGVFAYKTKVARFKKSNTGEKIFEHDADGNKVYDTVLKEFNNNFTPLRIFDAMYYTQFAKGKTVFQKNEKKTA